MARKDTLKALNRFKKEMSVNSSGGTSDSKDTTSSNKKDTQVKTKSSETKKALARFKKEHNVGSTQRTTPAVGKPTVGGIPKPTIKETFDNSKRKQDWIRSHVDVEATKKANKYTDGGHIYPTSPMDRMWAKGSKYDLLGVTDSHIDKKEPKYLNPAVLATIEKATSQAKGNVEASKPMPLVGGLANSPTKWLQQTEETSDVVGEAARLLAEDRAYAYTDAWSVRPGAPYSNKVSETAKHIASFGNEFGAKNKKEALSMALYANVALENNEMDIMYAQMMGDTEKEKELKKERKQYQQIKTAYEGLASVAENDYQRYVDIGAEASKNEPFILTQHGDDMGATDAEINAYKYLYGKYGKEKADEFLGAINEAFWLERKGKADAEWLADIDIPVLRELAYLGDSVLSGVQGGIRGVEEFFTGEKRVLPDDYKRQYVEEDLSKRGLNIGGKTVGQYLYGGGEVVGNMLPAIAVTTMTKGLGAPAAVSSVAGSATMGLSSAGHKVAELKERGYSDAEAYSVGVLVGASETALRHAIGGISQFGGVSSGKYAAKIAAADSALVRVLGTAGLKIGAEIGEEELQLFLEPLFESVILNEEYDAPEAEEMIYTAIITALSTGALESGNIASARKSYAPFGNDIIEEGDEAVAEVLQAGLESKEGSMPYWIASEIQKSAQNDGYVSPHKLGILGTSVIQEGVANPQTEDEEEDLPSSIEEAAIGRVISEETDGIPEVSEEVDNVPTEMEMPAETENNEVLDDAEIPFNVMAENPLTKTANELGVLTDTTKSILRGNKLSVGVKDGRAYVGDGIVSIPVDADGVDVARGWGARESNNLADSTEAELGGNFSPISTPKRANLPGYGKVYMYEADNGKTVAVSEKYAKYFDGYDLSASFTESGIPRVIKATDADGNLAGVVMAIKPDNNGEYNASDIRAVDGVKVSDVVPSVAPKNVLSMEAREGYEISRMRFGDYGKKALAEVAKGIPPSGIALASKNFRTAYEAGLTGVDASQVEFTTDVQQKGFEAGQKDRIMSIEKKVENVKNVVSHGKKAGFDGRNAPADTTDTQIKILDNLYKGMGVVGGIGKASYHYNANLETNIGRVTIAENFERKFEDRDVSVVFYGAHEAAFHRLMELAPREGRAFTDALFRYMGTDATSIAKDLMAKYARQGENISLDDAMEEVSANSILMLYNWDEAKFAEAVNRAVKEGNKQARLGANKFLRILNDIIERLRKLFNTLTGKQKAEVKADIDELTQLRNIFESALVAGVKKNAEIAREQKNLEIKTNKEYNGNDKYSAKTKYNEYNTIGMQWAYASDTQVGDLNVLYNKFTGKYVLVEATKEDVGFIELNSGNFAQMRKERNFYATEKNRLDGSEETVDKVLRDFGLRRNNNHGDNVDVGIRETRKRNAKLPEGKPNSNKATDTQTAEHDTRFSLKQPVEETKNLLALHNLTEEKLLKTLALGGIPMPSIAVTKADSEYGNFGDISLVMSKSTVDPKANRHNAVYSSDAWTPTYPRIEYKVNEKALDAVRKKIDALVPLDIQKELGSVHLDETNVEEDLNRNGGDLSSTYRYNYAMKYAFLRDTGVELDLPEEYRAARTAIDEATDAKNYEKWVKELFGDIVGKEGIRNEKDLFTPSGNRRSFESLHYEHNLENVIKAMREQGTKGIGGFGGGNIFGASATEYNSIEDLKTDAYKRLANLPQEEFDAIRKGFADRFFEMASGLPKHQDSFSAMDDAANMLVEAVAKYKTKNGMANYLRRESEGWANYSDSIVDDLIELVNDIRNMPVGYFEAKPERAVGFDEVLAAVLPDSVSDKLKAQLEKVGIDILTYEKGNSEDRLAKVNSVENAKFSLKDSEGNSLTKEQQEYFKDSKVRDKDGNLLVVYHGTPSGGFTEFKLPHYLSTLTSQQGAGYYFTDKANAKQYTQALNGKTAGKKQLYEVYLNITRPLEISQYSTGAISDESFRRIMARGNYKWGMEHTDVEKRLQVSRGDADRLMEMVRVFNGDEILEVMKDELGFDGVRFTDRYGDIWVAWSKEQIKNVDNANPTSNPDIRFSLKQPVEETKDLVAMHNMSEQQLLDVLTRGQFIMPSVAVTNKGLQTFGDISVLFGKDTIDPQNNSNNKLYGSDAWTPTQTELKKNPKFDDKATANVLRSIRKTLGDSQIFKDNSARFKQQIAKADGSVYNAYAHNVGMQAAYALENGMISAIPKDASRNANTKKLQSQLDAVLDKDSEWRKYKHWLSDISNKIITSYDKASNEDILRDMKSQPDYAKKFRLSEEGELTAPVVEYSSIEDFRSNKARLSENAEQDAASLGKEFLQWAKSIPGAKMRDVVNAINSSFDSRYSGKDIVKAFADKGITISSKNAETLQSLYKKAVELSTPYFEAKPQRGVGVNEIAAVVLPDNASSDVVSKLREAGINILTYKKGNSEDRLNKVNSVENVKFSLRDKDYMSAVEKGDTETAQKLVDEAAEEAFVKSKAREEDGRLRMVYHGTVNDFTVFEREFAQIEGDFGKGYYFTSNEFDVAANYASEEGPDLTNKIERYAEKLEWDDEYSELSYDERKKIAKEKFITSEPKTISAYLNIENPVYISPNEKGTFLDLEELYDEEYDEYGEPEGLLIDFVEALNNVSSEYAQYQPVDFSFLYEYAYDNGGMYASDAVGVIKKRIVDELVDETGDIAVSEVIRLAFEEVGFDGIIDSSVYYKFRNMNGMDSQTVHYIVFDSNQVKSAEPITYDDKGNIIPLSERFNPKNNDIRYSLRDSEGNTLTKEQQEYFKDSKARDENGNLLVMYHGTAKGGFTEFDTYAYYSKFGLFGNGAYFTDSKDIAEQYTQKGRGKTPQVYSAYLNITNPIDMDAKANIEAWNKALQKTGEDFELLKGEMTNEQAFKSMVEDLEDFEVYSYDAAEIVRNVFESMGYDGITHVGGGRVNRSDGTKHRVFIAFEPEQIKDVTNTKPTTHPDIRYSLRGVGGFTDLQEAKDFSRAVSEGDMNTISKYAEKGVISTELYNELIEEYGAIPKGENPYRDVEVPQKTEKNKKVSQTVRTILEAKATPDEAVPTIEKMVEDGVFSYEVYGDKKAIKDAEDYIKKYGWDESLDDWFDAVKKGEVSKETTTMGWMLYNNAANTAATTTDETERTTAIKTSLKILDAMVRHQRSAAQALQATRILKKMSPETQLYGVQKSVQAFQKELTDKYGKKAPDLKIDEGLAEEFLKAKTDEERAEILEKIYQDVGRQLPSSFIDKWNAWRYLAMLGNARTHVRNIFGNAFFAPVVNVKNIVATGIESAVHKMSGGKTARSKALLNPTNKADRELIKVAYEDYANVAEEISNGGKYNDFAMANRQIEKGRRIFKNKLLEGARKGNSNLLEVEDMWFSKPHYAHALAQYCKANKITAEQLKRGKALGAAREYAIKEAQKATYRDTNAFSQWVSNLGRIDTKKNAMTKGASMVLEGILPFRKTPANILVRGVEYSPIGLLRGIKQAVWDVRKGTKTSAEAIDSISAGLTGTALVALGMLLSNLGLIRGHGEDDEEKEFMEMMGHQAYSLELPNGTSITLDWLAPEALPFFVGVNLWEQTHGKDEDVTMSTILKTLSGISEPMLEMSCLQSLNDVFESVGYASSNDTSGLVSVVSSAATSYLMQGLPTLGGQAERTGEEHRMTTYTEKNSFLTKDMQYTLGKASAKIPFGWDYNQIPYIDAWGRKEASGNALKRGLNNFLNPAYTSTVETSAMEKELLRLYEQTGEGGVFPERADQYFTVDGERKDLTADEYVKYATLKGEKSYKLVTDLVKSKAYKQLSDTEKVEAVKKAYDYADQKAKKTVANYKPDKWVETADKFGKNAGNFISFKTEVNSTRNDNGGKISKPEVTDIIRDTAQNDTEIWDMYLNEYDSKKAQKVKDAGVSGSTYIDYIDALGDNEDVKKADVVDAIRDLNVSDSDAWALYTSEYDGQYVQLAKNAGISGNKYLDVLDARDKIDQPNDNGKLGTYTNDECTAAISVIRGLTNQERAILWQSLTESKSTKNNPWRAYLP